MLNKDQLLVKSVEITHKYINECGCNSESDAYIAAAQLLFSASAVCAAVTNPTSTKAILKRLIEYCEKVEADPSLLDPINVH